MPKTGNASAELQDPPLPQRAKLAAAWTSFMFLYAYVDILGFYMPGVLDDIAAGIVWEFEITQAWATGALTLMAIPILMVVLSVSLPARASRIANLAVAPVYILVSAGNAIGESWGYYFALAVGLEVMVLALILRLAWTWPLTPWSCLAGTQSGSGNGDRETRRGAAPGGRQRGGRGGTPVA